MDRAALPHVHPNSYIVSDGFCLMGIAVPGGAACLVEPDKRVVAISGDGGFRMKGLELATGVRLGVAPVNLVCEDNSYGLISYKQEVDFGRHFGTDFPSPDLAKVSQSLGCHAVASSPPTSCAPPLRKPSPRPTDPASSSSPSITGRTSNTTRLGQLIAH